MGRPASLDLGNATGDVRREDLVVTRTQVLRRSLRELDLIRSVEFEEHLRTCPDCARQLHDQQAMRQSLRAASLYERAPQSLEAKIRAQLPREARSKPIVKPRSPAIEWLAIAAAIVIAAFLGARVIPNIGGQQQTSLLVQELEPHPLAATGSLVRRAIHRPTHREALVRRQAELRAAGPRSFESGFSAHRRPA